MILVIMMVVSWPIVIDRSWIRRYCRTANEEKLNEYFPAFDKKSNEQDVELSTTRDTGYILYGDGVASQQKTKRLLHYIRALTSRQAPGGHHLRRTSGHFSQVGQSQLVDKLLKGRRGGVFLECGAAGGEVLSNSLFFELHRNWTGVLIEGNPQYYRKLLSKNRNAFVVRACLSPTTTPKIVKYTTKGMLSGIVNSRARANTIQCFPLNSVTAALGIRHIDYMSLDVEGPELNILQTVNWSQLSIDVLTVEYRARTTKLNQLRSFFNATGNYTEVGLLPHGTKDDTAQDVVFMRTRN